MSIPLTERVRNDVFFKNSSEELVIILYSLVVFIPHDIKNNKNNIQYLIYNYVKLNNKKHLLKHSIFVVGRAYATSSHLIPQGGNAARVYGRSGVI